MSDVFRHLRSREVISRLVADLLLIHMCMLIAVLACVALYTIAGMPDMANRIGTYFPRYYSNFFVPLSVLFPASFIVSGFYTRSRGYSDRYKALVVVRGV